jgi:hypothetical protein
MCHSTQSMLTVAVKAQQVSLDQFTLLACCGISQRHSSLPPFQQVGDVGRWQGEGGGRGVTAYSAYRLWQ